MKATVKKDQPVFKLRAGDIIEVELLERRSVVGCVYHDQNVYRVVGKNYWLPEEDLNITPD